MAGLPTVGPGALKSREDPNERSGKVCPVFVYSAGHFPDVKYSCAVVVEGSQDLVIVSCV